MPPGCHVNAAGRENEVWAGAGPRDTARMSASPVRRFHDPGLTAHHFAGSQLVRCPRCARVAHRTRQPAPHDGHGHGDLDGHGGRPPGFRLVCRSCGLNRAPSEPVPVTVLWLSARTRHGTIWAYNLEHLDLLRRFVAAGLRERDPWYTHGPKMTSVGRLPAWMKAARNRAEVLRVIDRMRASVVNSR